MRQVQRRFFRRKTACRWAARRSANCCQAAKADWQHVEPAIFGTLLEQALNPAERRKLGAHYTPRAYVERLVVATIIEPLRDGMGERSGDAPRPSAPTATPRAPPSGSCEAFHEQLCETRMLDPACGTGNFLYVALELMKRLEGEVLEALASLSAVRSALRRLRKQDVDPHQFLGLEINPRAAAIAELVLWIGYLQWHFRTRGGLPPEPILQEFKNIKVTGRGAGWRDHYACARDESGKPITRPGPDGHPIEVYRYDNPQRPEWPPAEFIVGNPPFIGGKDLRGRLGEDYAEALWAAHPHMNESADFVMYWWDRAADC